MYNIWYLYEMFDLKLYFNYLLITFRIKIFHIWKIILYK